MGGMELISPEMIPWPFSPVSELSPILLIEYIVFFLFSGIIARKVYNYMREKDVMEIVDKGDGSGRNVPLISAALAGPVEEAGYRGVAVEAAFILGLPIVPVLLVVNGFWASRHTNSYLTFVYTFVLGLFFTRFWYQGFSGLWWVAVLFHSGHNVLTVVISDLIGPQEGK